MYNWRIPLSDLDYGPEEEAAALRVLESKWLSMGPEVEAFEKEFGEFVGARYAFAVSSGTAALHLSLLALELGPGDEIIQPAINFVATANMTVAVGATPVFADIVDLDEPTIDPMGIGKGVTERTKAVVVMHYGGYLCRMAEIMEICRENGLFVVEDACHAVGAGYKTHGEIAIPRRMAGAIGDIGCFSFFSNKNLAIGEGGMVVTNREDLAERIRLLRSHGMTTLTWDRHRGHANSYDVVLHGLNYRLDELRAALGRCQLSKLKANNKRRRVLVQAYRENLSGLKSWIIPFKNYLGDSAYHLMVVVAPTAEIRQQTVEALTRERIQSSLHYPFLPAMSAFKGHQSNNLPVAMGFSSRAITLPLFPGMEVREVEDVCSIITRIEKKRDMRT